MQHHVCRLQASVQDALLMQPLHALRHPQQHLQQDPLQDNTALGWLMPSRMVTGTTKNYSLKAESTGQRLSKLDCEKLSRDTQSTDTTSTQ
jgi:hypothetical protein